MPIFFLCARHGAFVMPRVVDYAAAEIFVQIAAGIAARGATIFVEKPAVFHATR